MTKKNDNNLALLNDQLDEAYHVYVSAYANSMVHNVICPVAPEGKLFGLVGHLAMAMAARGATHNYALLTKADFHERMTHALTGKGTI